MLLPALGKARATAQKVACANKLAQLGKMMMLYADDNKGHVHHSPSSTYGNSYGRFDDTEAAFFTYIGVQADDDGADKFYKCPSPQIMTGKLSNLRYSYGLNYNWTISKGASNVLYKHMSPSKSMLFAERAARDESLTQLPWYADSFSGGTKAVNSWLYARRHNNSLNLCYADGHVSSLTDLNATDHGSSSVFMDYL